MSKYVPPIVKNMPRPRLSNEAGQFSITFESELRRIVVIAMEDLHGSLLVHGLSTLNANVVIDTRSVVRFDLPSMNREFFFRILSGSATQYLRQPLDWPASKGVRLATSTSLVTERMRHELLDKSNRNLAFLVSKSHHAAMLASEVNLVLTTGNQTNWDLSIWS